MQEITKASEEADQLHELLKSSMRILSMNCWNFWPVERNTKGNRSLKTKAGLTMTSERDVDFEGDDRIKSFQRKKKRA